MSTMTTNGATRFVPILNAIPNDQPIVSLSAKPGNLARNISRFQDFISIQESKIFMWTSRFKI